ncbi:hypothetical protein [Tomitella fengzijianii]|uniref:hypothetical protein n=1 Tax=Tomitella fengzijianii TaxID=2597660 RepID=UPI0018EED5CE|nr:hypothetical protein [Tomitella fengzijianii]
MSSEPAVSGRATGDAPGTGAHTLRTRLDQALSGPFVGMVPWIILGVFEGPGRTQWAVLVGLLFAIGFLILDRVQGRSVKLLTSVSALYFLILLIVVFTVGDQTVDWLEIWLGEISNISLTVIVLGSMAIRLPFTLQYAREQTPRELWDSPVFLRINYVITGAWALAFLVSSAAGFYGDYVLGDNNDIWTGWVIQVGAMLMAVEFTAWYPDHARAHAITRAGGTPDQPAPPVTELFAPLTVWFIPIGIISLVLDAAPTWLGIAFIVVGVVLSGVLRRDLEKERTTDAGDGR